MLNTIREPITIGNFGGIQQRADLPTGMFIEKLQLALNGTVDIAAGGGADGTVIADGVARLIRRIQVRRDNEIIVDLTGRDLLILTRAAVKTSVVTGTQLSGAGVGAQTLDLTLALPFARPWLVNPFETVLPPMRYANVFSVFVDWAQDVNAGAGSAAGSGVLVSGGTRVITFTTAPSLTITVYGALRGKLPWFLPYYSSTDSDTFAAANARLEYKLNEARRFDAVFISPRHGALAADADLLNTLTFGAQSQTFFNGIRARDLRSEQKQQFAGAGSDLNFYLLLSGGGWISNAVEPDQMTKPFFRFDVAAPTAPGLVHLLFSELISHPEYTLHGRGLLAAASKSA